MKTIVRLAILFALILCACFMFCSCDNDSEKVVLTSENYDEYLTVNYTVRYKRQANFLYSSVPGVKRMYEQPKMIISVSPIDSTHTFKEGTIKVSARYIYQYWDLSGGLNSPIGFSDIVQDEFTINIDSTGHGSVSVRSSTTPNRFYVAGFIDVIPTEVSTTVTIPCVHDWKDVAPTKEATCEADGIMSMICVKCEHTSEKPIPAIGHNYDMANSTLSAPTCTKPGIKEYPCLNCGNMFSENALPAQGHKFNENNICTECGATKTDTE